MNNFYTATVYEKGAEVIRMIHTLIGKEGFKKGMDIYFKKYDGKAVTTEEFLTSMEEGANIDLTQFRLWYDQSGTPILHVKEEFEDETYKLTFTQEIPKTLDGKDQKEMFYPLNIALFNEDGSLFLEKQIIIKDKTQMLEFKTPKKLIPSINRNFSAPIIVKGDFDYPFLARVESDGFMKYEALLLFAKESIKQLAKEDSLNKEFIKVYGEILDEDLELMFKSLILELPSLNTIISDEEDIDIEVFSSALDKLSSHLSTTYKEKFLEIYKTYHDAQNNSIDSTSKGKRAIKNLALNMLGNLKTDEIFDLASKQYKTSKSMTDKLVALKVADNIDHIKAKELFDDFYAKYSDNSLLMVKYFSILASLDNEIVLQRVKELEKDKAFDIKVPNLVRALYGSFARNLKYFHSKDGSGYEFIAQKIKEIDAINAQMGASLCGTFKLYPKLNRTCKDIINEKLSNLLDEKISSNSYEIITKTINKK
jgi:aminopeptidase N